MTIKTRFQQLKKESGLTSEEISEKSGISYGTINKILNGQTKHPSYDIISKLADALNCTTDDFRDDDDRKPETLDGLIEKMKRVFKSKGTPEEEKEVITKTAMELWLKLKSK